MVEHVENPPLASQRAYYSIDGMTAELRQGEIISGLTQYSYNPSTGDVDALPIGLSIVATQDCDLLQDFTKRRDAHVGDLNCILLFEAQELLEFKKSVPPGKDIWKKIIQNKDERYQALQAISNDIDLLKIGIPDLVVDFKRLFAISPDDFYNQINSGTTQRRCRLEMPYREHFQNRAAFYLQRVMLPEPHKVVGPG
jgi:hypothetical protein